MLTAVSEQAWGYEARNHWVTQHPTCKPLWHVLSSTANAALCVLLLLFCRPDRKV